MSLNDIEHVGEFTYISFTKEGFNTIEEAEDWVEQKIEENNEETDIVEELTYSYNRGKWAATVHLSSE